MSGQYRRAFGGAIAFENALAEFLHPDLAGFRLDAFGAGDDEADIVEIVRMGVARIAHQEGVGAEKDRGVGIVAKLGDHLVVERRGIEEGAHTREHGQHGAGGESEGMEHRQGIEDDVMGGEVDARESLEAVCLDVAMREDDALGHAFGARGEEDHCRRIGIGIPLGHAQGGVRHETRAKRP